MRLSSHFIWLILILAFNSNASDNDYIAVVASASHAKEVNKESLTQIFKRKKLFWTNGDRIQPVNLPTQNALRKNFSNIIFQASPEELEKYWNMMYFQGITPPHVISSEESVMKFVFETPGAIGYISLCNVDKKSTIALVLNANGQVISDTNISLCP